MGLDAEVIAVGPFSPDIADFLDYPAELYRDTKPGAMISVLLLQCNTSQQSHELADCMGFQAFDFNRHHFDGSSADVDRLRRTFSFDARQVDKFLALRDKGFSFYYRPNG